MRENIAIAIGKGDLNFILAENEAAAEKIIFCGASADDDGAGLTIGVGFVTDGAELLLVHMAADHQIGLHLLTEQSTPLAVDRLLDVKGRPDLLCEGAVGDDELRFDALGGVFTIRIFDECAEKIRLSFAEGVTSDGVAVFGMQIVFILTAVEKNAPKTAKTEGIIRVPVLVGSEIREFLGEIAAHIVVAAGKDHGACARS